MATQKYRERMAESEPNCSPHGSESERQLEGEKDKGRGELLKESKEGNRSNRILNQKEDETEEDDDQSDDQNRNLHKKRKMKQKKKQEPNSKSTMKEGDDCSAGGGDGGLKSNNGLAVRRERLFPRMSLRILLVEADDSTRQIIAVLLRKCSYRVAAVADGLTAWEVLKQRPHSIDLILTEFDLPSISGYALLSLIMEHEMCKNIPVIMMSKEDSISTVYKCMVRGAADYLVKPVRRNELRNLWQHVWRRHIQQLSRDNFPQDESVGQDRAEAASENNAATNRSAGNVDCAQKNNENAEKGSDTQSSCTKPDMEAECTGNEQELLQQVGVKSFGNETKDERCEAFTGSNQRSPVLENEARGSTTGEGNNPDGRILYEDTRAETERTRTDINMEAGDSNSAKFNREGIDFMGAAAVNKCAIENINSNFGSNPDLDPSLKSTHPGELEIQGTEERHTLRHSNTSAFTRYTGRQSYFQHSTSSSVSNPKEPTADSERNFSNVADSGGPSPSVFGDVTLPAVQIKEPETENSSHQKSAVQIPTPVARARINDKNTGYTSMFPPFESEKSAISPPQSPSSVKVSDHHSYFRSNNSERLGDQLCLASESTTKETMKIQDKKLESLEDQGCISPVTDQKSASSSFCDGGLSHRNSMGYGSTCGSNSDVDQVVMNKAEADSKDEGVFTHVKSSSTRSAEREAALAKFRLKRKERCYDKKVRYESRKTLAEQRPRVKGQFVRQVPAVASTFRT
ncbi:Two-component response regulator-like APRR5 [Linum perenne]